MRQGIVPLTKGVKFAPIFIKECVGADAAEILSIKTCCTAAELAMISPNNGFLRVAPHLSAREFKVSGAWGLSEFVSALRQDKTT